MREQNQTLILVKRFISKRENLTNVFASTLNEKLKEIDLDKISNSYKEVVQNNIVEEKDFNLGKIKFDDKILHKSKLLKYFNNEIDKKSSKRFFKNL